MEGDFEMVGLTVGSILMSSAGDQEVAGEISTAASLHGKNSSQSVCTKLECFLTLS